MNVRTADRTGIEMAIRAAGMFVALLLTLGLLAGSASARRHPPLR